MYLHTHAIKLLYKCNITLIAVRYGCMSAHYDYQNHSRSDIQAYRTATSVIYYTNISYLKMTCIEIYITYIS